MGIYSYSQSKLIDEIAFIKSEGGQTRAYLHAVNGADPKTLHDIACKLAEQGWQVTPYNMGAKPVLEVLGFGKESKLLTMAKSSGWVEGESTHKKNIKDKLSLMQQVRKRSLGVSGIFYLLGDASFTKYGYSSNDPFNTIAGVMYGAGTSSLLGFGRKDQSDLQVREIAKKLDAYMKENIGNLPESCSLDSIVSDHKKGVIRKADDLFRRYPSEMMNIFFALAGVFIAKSAIAHGHSGIANDSIEQVLKRKQLKNPHITRAVVEEKMYKFKKLEGKLDVGLGAMTGLSGLFAASVKEKAPDPDAPEKHGMAAVWEKIQQKPLAIAGVGYMVSTMCHAVSTGIAWSWSDNKRRSSVGWRTSFIVNNIIAEILLAISSKGHGSGVKADHSVDSTIIALASEIIVKHPPAMQEQLIDHVARFLGRRDVLAAKDDVVRRQLHEQVAAMRKNPWAVHKAELGQQAAPAVAEAAKDESWQARVSQPQPGQQPQLSS